MNTIELEDNLGIKFCTKQPIAIERGRGSYVWDEDGKKYLDFTSGWGVTCLGHSNSVITEAITGQAKKLIQNPNSGFTYSPVRSKLLKALAAVLPINLDNIFFANSGAEANDAAIKLARKVTGRTAVVSTRESFHGRTYNTLSLSGGIENTNKFLPVMSENYFAEYGDMEEMRSLVTTSTAAVILEPIQGEGGARIPPDGYLRKVSAHCKSVGALLILDEVQTGFCRTGKFFAIDGHDVDVDILTMGKGIAGGFPFAAFAVNSLIADKLLIGDHGGTYCGNPLACAVSLAVIEYLLDNKVAKQAAHSGAEILSRLKLFAQFYPKIIRHVRGQGLLVAIEFTDNDYVEKITQSCMHRGLLVTPTRNSVIRLIPDLLINEDAITAGLDIIEQCLAEL